MGIGKRIANKKYDFYIAAPFFNPKQLERIEFVKMILKKFGYTYFSPKDKTYIPPNATQKEREKAFRDNCEAILNSKYVIAITDDKDMGTIWEAGFAYAMRVPIMYYAETLGDKPFNLMLALSGHKVITSREELNENVFRTLNRKDIYEGEIE